LLLHEVIHAGGYGHAQGNESGDYGRDQVYACARFGTNCAATTQDGQYLAVKPPDTNVALVTGWKSSSRDAARCASDLNKKQFGARTIYLDSAQCSRIVIGTLISTNGAQCADGQGGGSPAQACRRHQSRYCDLTPVNEMTDPTNVFDEPVCALSCPASASILDPPCSDSNCPTDPDGPVINTNEQCYQHVGACPY
jgi:hypothetical protein